MFTTSYDEEEKLWSGPNVTPLYNPKISLAAVVLDSMGNFGPKIAQISDNNGVEKTFDELRLSTIRVAQNLQSRGYEPKQVFGLMAKNSENVASIVFGTVAIGCAINSLDPTFKKTELLHMLNITKPSVMFCDVEVYELVKECLTELENEAAIFTFGDTAGDSKAIEDLLAETGTEESFIPVEVDGKNDAAMIICSSGTTGLSKGVCLSHAACLDSFTQNDLITFHDITMCFSSLYWISGVVVLFRGTIKGATRIITTDAFSAELQLRFIEQYKVTHSINAPHHIILMLKHEKFKETDLSSYRKPLVGGGKVPFHVQTELNANLNNGFIHVVFGMSEAAGLVTCNSISGKPSGKDSVGQIMGGIKMKIIDDDHNRIGPNEDGEIAYKAIYKFLGYYSNRKATDELFDNEGFILTGDIGHFDEDGELYIIDRKKDMMKYCNMQISPSAIEAYLIESPDIKTACVVGIPDEVATDLPAAVIVRANGSNISSKEIYDMVADQFSDHCKLRGGVYFVDEVATTPSGKVLRRKAREYAIDMYNKQTNEYNS